ncbi:MAG: methylaspartate mutase, partial [Planctomycetota bacterium]
PLGIDQTAEIEVLPAKNFDVGAGKGKPITKKVFGGVVGIVIDTRGKPITLAKDKALRVEQLQRWAKALDAYPE